MAETSAQQKAKQRANSLAEQRQRFLKTGRPTKGLINAGEAVASQKYVIQKGDSPFSVARKILGPNASESMVAAFVQQQGWLGSFTTGDTLDIAGAYISPNARPTTDFMLAANAQSALIGAPVGFANLGITPTGGASTAPPPPANYNPYSDPHRKDRGYGSNVGGVAQGLAATAERYTGLGAQYAQQGINQYQQSERNRTVGQAQPAQPYYGNLANPQSRNETDLGDAFVQSLSPAVSGLQAANQALGGALTLGNYAPSSGAPATNSTTASQAQQTTALSLAAQSYAKAIELAAQTGNRSYLPPAGSSAVWGEVVAANPEMWGPILTEAGLEVSGMGLGAYLGHDINNFDPAINGYPRLDAAAATFSQSDLRNMVNDYRYHPTRPTGVRFVRTNRGRGAPTPADTELEDGSLSNSGGYGPSMMASWNVDF